MVGGSMNGKTNNPPGGYSMEVAVVRPPFCFACAYSRNVWQAPRTGDALPGGKVDADILLLVFSMLRRNIYQTSLRESKI